MEHKTNCPIESDEGSTIETARNSPASPASHIEVAEIGETGSGISQVRFFIENMHCRSCVSRIENALKILPDILSYSVDLKGQTVDVDYQTEMESLSLIRTAVESTGHKISKIASL